MSYAVCSRLLCSLSLACASVVCAAEPDPQELVKQVVTAAGGSEKLLTLFRVKEHLIIGSDPEGKGFERISVLEPPRAWWSNGQERVSEQKEPAIFLVWAWSLQALVDPKSKIEALPEIKEKETAAFGLRVSQSIDPPLEMYFDSIDNRLVRIDWRSDIHRFSQWKQHDGVGYAAKCVGYKKDSGKPWYFSELLEVERLKELPEGLKR